MGRIEREVERARQDAATEARLAARRGGAVKYLPWLLLILTTLYRHTWGSCDCPALRRRLALAHRETAGYRYEAHIWRTRFETLQETQ